MLTPTQTSDPNRTGFRTRTLFDLTLNLASRWMHRYKVVERVLLVPLTNKNDQLETVDVTPFQRFKPNIDTHAFAWIFVLSSKPAAKLAIDRAFRDLVIGNSQSQKAGASAQKGNSWSQTMSLARARALARQGQPCENSIYVSDSKTHGQRSHASFIESHADISDAVTKVYAPFLRSAFDQWQFANDCARYRSDSKKRKRKPSDSESDDSEDEEETQNETVLNSCPVNPSFFLTLQSAMLSPSLQNAAWNTYVDEHDNGSYTFTIGGEKNDRPRLAWVIKSNMLESEPSDHIGELLVGQQAPPTMSNGGTRIRSYQLGFYQEETGRVNPSTMAGTVGSDGGEIKIPATRQLAKEIASAKILGRRLGLAEYYFSEHSSDDAFKWKYACLTGCMHSSLSEDAPGAESTKYAYNRFINTTEAPRTPFWPVSGSFDDFVRMLAEDAEKAHALHGSHYVYIKLLVFALPFRRSTEFPQRPTHSWVSGESGSGKSLLLARFDPEEDNAIMPNVKVAGKASRLTAAYFDGPERSTTEDDLSHILLFTDEPDVDNMRDSAYSPPGHTKPVDRGELNRMKEHHGEAAQVQAKKCKVNKVTGNIRSMTTYTSVDACRLYVSNNTLFYCDPALQRRMTSSYVPAARRGDNVTFAELERTQDRSRQAKVAKLFQFVVCARMTLNTAQQCGILREVDVSQADLLWARFTGVWQKTMRSGILPYDAARRSDFLQATRAAVEIHRICARAHETGAVPLHHARFLIDVETRLVATQAEAAYVLSLLFQTFIPPHLWWLACYASTDTPFSSGPYVAAPIPIERNEPKAKQLASLWRVNSEGLETWLLESQNQRKLGVRSTGSTDGSGIVDHLREMFRSAIKSRVYDQSAIWNPSKAEYVGSQRQVFTVLPQAEQCYLGIHHLWLERWRRADTLFHGIVQDSLDEGVTATIAIPTLDESQGVFPLQPMVAHGTILPSQSDEMVIN